MDRATVLVPLDGSPLAEAALPYAEAVAAVTSAPLLLVGVVRPVSSPPAAPAAIVPLEARSPLELAELAALEDYLEITATTLRAGGLQVATALKIGEPAEQILAAAAEEDAGMVVMATRGRSAVERLREGSVADQVLRLSTRPTLLVRPGSRPRPRRDVALRRLLVPLDGSPLAEAALAPAIRLAAGETLLLLVRVEPDAAADRIVAAGAYLDSVKRALPPGVRATTAVLPGTAADALLDLAQRQSVDLIVMSMHGHGGLRRLVLPSTTDRIVRSGVPVLVVPPAGEPSTG